VAVSSTTSVVILVADGVRPDTLAASMDGGELPALAGLRAEGAMHVVTTCFPSVTGVGYSPMLLGRFPGSVGLPGLRWYDRARRLPGWLGHSRSYVGVGLRRIDEDLDPHAPTAFELAGGISLGALSVITRGLRPADRLEHGARVSMDAAWRHVRGDVEGWLALERGIADRLVTRIRRERPRYVFAAFPAGDKAAHAGGHESPLVREGLRTIDAVAGGVRADAERDGRWRGLHLWVVSDHGHGALRRHEDLARFVRSLGLRVRAHPWTGPGRAEVAVMVSGNAMAHVYLDLDRRERPWWGSLQPRWRPLVNALLQLPAVDLVALPRSPTAVEVARQARGSALVVRQGDRYSYQPIDGDPLGLAAFANLDRDAALERGVNGEHPDAVVQLTSLAGAARSGDVIVSATPGWDFREGYEPIAHVSSHGALHRDHMMVPLLLGRPAALRPARTADIMPSALRALGLGVPPGLDGRSFI
jgi:hypothetical protein